MTLSTDQKIRYGMMALAGASLVAATFGVHITPLQIVGGMGGG